MEVHELIDLGGRLVEATIGIIQDVITFFM